MQAKRAEHLNFMTIFEWPNPEFRCDFKFRTELRTHQKYNKASNNILK